MDIFRPRDLRALTESPAGPSVSIYMPAERAGRETRQNPIRFKNLLGEAGAKLEMIGGPEGMLGPAEEMLRDEAFWQQQSDGLAVFIGEGTRRVFRLPEAFPELVVAADRFHLKPLIAFLGADDRFLVLSVSQNRIRLLQGSRQAIHEVELEDVPESLRDLAVHRDEASLQHHVGRAGRAAIFHGHGGESDEEHIKSYLRSIDQGLRAAIPDVRTPLVLAGVRFLTDLYRQTSAWPEILPETIQGNPDEAPDEALRAEAWRIAEARAAERRQAAVRRFADLEPRGLTFAGISDVVPAASHGRIEVLWVATGVQRWGTFDRETDRVEVREQPRAGDRDLLDLAASDAYLNGATVHAVPAGEVPGDAPAAAILRY